MENLLFKFNWCDYFTPCPHGKDCMIGDHTCYTCIHCKSYIVNSERFKNTDKIDNDYRKYFIINEGHVMCSFNEDNK